MLILIHAGRRQQHPGNHFSPYALYLHSDGISDELAFWKYFIN